MPEEERIDVIHLRLAEHISEEKARDELMIDQIKALTDQVQSLIKMWEQARGAILFVKVMSGLVAAAAATWSFVSAHGGIK